MKELEPTLSCSVDTPVGEIVGKKCPKGERLFHRTHADKLEGILEDGEISPSESKHGLEDTGITSMSSNPSHTFGGSVRLVMDPKRIDGLEPVCYYDHDEMEEKVFELEDMVKEEDPNIMPNEWRAKYGINPLNPYADECEWFTREDIEKEAIDRIEYWYPWRRPSSNCSCENKGPKYAMGYAWGRNFFEDVKEDIEESREMAEKMGVDFEVRSCFKWLQKKKDKRNSRAKEWCRLDEDNLDRLKEGEDLVCQDEKPEIFEEGPIHEYKKEDQERLRKACRC
jgi:hypothetical protein